MKGVDAVDALFSVRIVCIIEIRWLSLRNFILTNDSAVLAGTDSIRNIVYWSKEVLKFCFVLQKNSIREENR